MAIWGSELDDLKATGNANSPRMNANVVIIWNDRPHVSLHKIKEGRSSRKKFFPAMLNG